MANIMDYLNWRGDIPFDVSPFNEVDNLIFSELSYIHLAGLQPEDGRPVPLRAIIPPYLKKYGEGGNYMGKLLTGPYLELLKKVADSRRYENLWLTAGVNRIVADMNKQFSAFTYTVPGLFSYVAFRGTDDTIIGWREDCNMAFQDHIPAQEDAVQYLKESAAMVSEPLYVGGHSKGGNLAVYAAAKAPNEVKRRIRHIYSNDGPGFDRSFFETEEYMLIRNRVTLIMPKCSIIGAIFDQDCEQRIVECDRQGVMAHDGFCWDVLGTDFVRADSLVKSSRAFQLGMNRALKGMTREEKREFTDSMFNALTVTGAKTITDLTKLRPKEALKIGQQFTNHREILIVFSRIFQESLHGYISERKAQQTVVSQGL